MEMILDFFKNPFLITTVCAWIVVQFCKGMIHFGIYKEFDIKRFFGDGGMPSAHAATVSSLATSSGICYGFASFQFAVCAIMAIIVCRDAVGVRMETGKQAKIINDLRDYVLEMGKGEIDDTKLKEFVGHTPLQVVVGFAVGVIVAVITSLILF